MLIKMFTQKTKTLISCSPQYPVGLKDRETNAGNLKICPFLGGGVELRASQWTKKAFSLLNHTSIFFGLFWRWWSLELFAWAALELL
jgi:hypothetical protein